MKFTTPLLSFVSRRYQANVVVVEDIVLYMGAMHYCRVLVSHGHTTAYAPTNVHVIISVTYTMIDAFYMCEQDHAKG